MGIVHGWNRQCSFSCAHLDPTVLRPIADASQQLRGSHMSADHEPERMQLCSRDTSSLDPSRAARCIVQQQEHCAGDGCRSRADFTAAAVALAPQRHERSPQQWHP